MAGEIAQQALRQVVGNDPQTLYAMGIIFFTLMGVDKVAFWIARFRSRNGNGKSSVPQDMQDRIKKLYDQHNKYDEDGKPLWYVPRSWQTTQIEISNNLRDVAESQHRVSDCMERLENKLN